jgi:hypothetical protein
MKACRLLTTAQIDPGVPRQIDDGRKDDTLSRSANQLWVVEFNSCRVGSADLNNSKKQERNDKERAKKWPKNRAWDGEPSEERSRFDNQNPLSRELVRVHICFGPASISRPILRQREGFKIEARRSFSLSANQVAPEESPLLPAGGGL